MFNSFFSLFPTILVLTYNMHSGNILELLGFHWKAQAFWLDLKTSKAASSSTSLSSYSQLQSYVQNLDYGPCSMKSWLWLSLNQLWSWFSWVFRTNALKISLNSGWVFWIICFASLCFSLYSSSSVLGRYYLAVQ